MKRVQLLALDASLADGIPQHELELAARATVADAVRVEAGPVDIDERGGLDGDGAPGDWLLLRGALTQEVALSDRISAQLLTPGDVLRTRSSFASLVPHDVRWVATEPSVLAELGERFWLAARRWPSLAHVIQQRLHDQAERLSVHVAISQLGRVEMRLLALFWHLAEKQGLMTPEGVRLPLRLTHETLGRLVGAQRPTVTLALIALAETATVVRASDGEWLLARESAELLAPAPARDVSPPLPAPLRAVPATAT